MSWLEEVRLKFSRGSSVIFGIVLVQPCFKYSELVLLFEENSALKVAESAIYGIVLVTAFESCKIWVSFLEGDDCRRQSTTLSQLRVCCKCKNENQTYDSEPEHVIQKQQATGGEISQNRALSKAFSKFGLICVRDCQGHYIMAHIHR